MAFLVATIEIFVLKLSRRVMSPAFLYLQLMQDLPVSELSAFFFAFAVSSFEFFLSLHNHKKRWIVVIWLVLACGSLGFGIYAIMDKNTNEAKSTQSINDTTNARASEVQNKIDSIKNAVLDSIASNTKDLKKALNESTKTGEKIAFIDLATLPPNPKLFFEGDSCVFRFAIRNYGSDDAFSLHDKIILVNYKEKKPKIDTKDPIRIINPTIPIPVNQGLSISFVIKNDSLNNIKEWFKYPVYAYIKITYTNSKNKPMRPFERIFALKTGVVAEVDNTDFRKVYNDLKNERVL